MMVAEPSYQQSSKPFEFEFKILNDYIISTSITKPHYIMLPNPAIMRIRSPRARILVGFNNIFKEKL